MLGSVLFKKIIAAIILVVVTHKVKKWVEADK